MEAEVRIEHPSVVLHTRPAFEMEEEEFFEFCRINGDWRIERTAEGDLEVMVPTGFEASDQNSEINMQLRLWAKDEGTGRVSESSGVFVLPNGAIRSPDAAWVRRERLANLGPQQKQRFLPLCPDFVVELRSPSDPLSPIEAKMHEYVRNGARLGWLIDPITKLVHVYRDDGTVEILENPQNVQGDPVLPGFKLDLRPVWEPDL